MITFKDIHIRDPYILVHQGQYYMYGSRGNEAWGKCTGLDVYVSKDLENWTEATEVFRKPPGFWSDMNYWAPEVHPYRDKFYMFVSFKSETRCRGTQILVSDSPMGPFLIHSDGPVTPADWECLDGTLYIDKDNVPYMVFCHEWVQVDDGEMCAMQLSDDLSKAVGDPFLLFKASEPSWALRDKATYVTDGPFLYRTKNNELLMIWSSFTDDGYVEAVSFSDNGEIMGNWLHKDQLLFSKDGGHGMIFTGMDNKQYLVFHTPNDSPHERPKIVEIYERDDMLFTK